MSNTVEYNVTATMSGRMLRVDDLDGHMIGMAQVDGSNVSVLAPRQGQGFDAVKGAANTYLHLDKAATAGGQSSAAIPASCTRFYNGVTVKPIGDASGCAVVKENGHRRALHGPGTGAAFPDSSPRNAIPR
jgi:hypothetical protein